ncbi:cytochrome P450 6B5-like [Leguminivora glycinivorella]|uniref:cytochrome P450 6B5-like n=1 Tax=Leguminivora glycinivorella TaxID=1035111 RepID=UPI00201077BF|nr:cytochrome P450 6B5-like [Leguminivora glycinivorella]
MALAYILLGLSTVAYLLYLYFTRTFNYWKDRSVPGPAPVPLFGNMMESALRRTHASFVMAKIYHDFPDEKVVGVYRMTSPCLLIRDPDIVKHIMIKDFDNFVDRGVHFSDDKMGNNLFHADAKTWRILRNKFTPLFTSGKLKNMLCLLHQCSDKVMKHVEESVRIEPEQEVYELMGNFTMGSIAACAFGLDLDPTEKTATMEALKNINHKLLGLTHAYELILMYPEIFIKFGVSVFPDELANFFKGLVAQVTAARNGVPTNRKDFMDLLLEMKQANTVQGNKRLEGKEADTLEITDDLIVAQAFVIYAGGYETSATTLAYMLYRLALNPEIQEKVAAEIDEVFERHGGEITYEALKDLTYMDKVFHETLRLHTVGDSLLRVSAEDYKVPGTNVTLRKGQTAVIPNIGIHYDEKYWPDPFKFDPERFSLENVAKRNPAVFLPFGIGPRNCIGVRFAKMQIRLMMARLLSQFRVEATENTTREFRYNTYYLVAFPIGGIRMKFVPRH